MISNFKFQKYFFSKLFFMSLVNLILINNAYAAIDEIYRLSLGVSLESYNSNLSINSRDSSIDKKIDFEDDLGFNNEANSGWLSGWYRVGDLHRIRLTYTPIYRSTSATNTTDIIIDNTTIKAGANIASESESEILDFSYIYSFYKTPELELGFSSGIYWLFSSTKIIAAGEILAEGNDQAEFKADYFSEQKLQAPMPLFGLSANYEIIPNWRAHAAIRYLSLQVNEINGRIFSTEVGSEYYFNDNVGIGMSLTFFELDIEVERLISNTSLSWSHNGVQVYAVFKY